MNDMLLHSFSGKVEQIEDFSCEQRLTIQAENNITHLIVNKDTLIVNREQIMVGDEVTIYIDANAPAPLIYPPLYHAVIISKLVPHYTVKASHFDYQLISEDGQLQLHIGDQTIIQYENGQYYTGQLENRLLAVVYDRSTRSIPAQTTPLLVTVICSSQ